MPGMVAGRSAEPSDRGPPPWRSAAIRPPIARHAKAALAALAATLLLGSGCGVPPGEAAARFVRRLGGRVPSPARFDLAQTPTTDADLERLVALGRGGLGEVRELDLTRTRITDRGLPLLAGLPGLTKLTLTLTSITDAGLDSLALLEHLADLALIETAVTDAAIAPLSKLTRLERLVLMRTAVSEAALAELRRALPGAAIHAGPPATRGRGKSAAAQSRGEPP